jgi:hypothetical protein
MSGLLRALRLGPAFRNRRSSECGSLLWGECRHPLLTSPSPESAEMLAQSRVEIHFGPFGHGMTIVDLINGFKEYQAACYNTKPFGMLASPGVNACHKEGTR